MSNASVTISVKESPNGVKESPESVEESLNSEYLVYNDDNSIVGWKKVPDVNLDEGKLNPDCTFNDIKKSLLDYGGESLKFAIKEHDLDLIEFIYKRCIDYFEKDGDGKFLSIITSAFPEFNEYYPEYIKRYSLDTNMIIDSS